MADTSVSTLARPYCPCKSCQVRDSLWYSGIWVHVGKGCSRDPITYYPFKSTDTSLPSSTITSFFRDMSDETSSDLGSFMKPNNSIWFSHGSWITNNPFGNGWAIHDNDEEELMNGQQVIAIQEQNLKNILYIKTLEDLERFVSKYPHTELDPRIIQLEHNLFKHTKHTDVSLPIDDPLFKHFEKIYKCSITDLHDAFYNAVFDKETNTVFSLDESFDRLKEQFARIIPKFKFNKFDTTYVIFEKFLQYAQLKALYTLPPVIINYGINWNKVRDDGYYGVAFEFTKVSELGVSFEKCFEKYMWHCGFDVESLAIWNINAFDNTVVPIEIQL